MKKTLLAISMLAAGSAHAVDFEIGTGTTHYQTAHDGLWYQAQYPHKLDLNAVPMSFGISFKPTNIRYRVEYLHMGWFYSYSQFVYDHEYYPGTNAKPVGTMLGRGQVGGLALTASRDVNVLGIPLYAEFGPYLHAHNFNILVYGIGASQGVNINASHSPAIGYIVGVGVRHAGIDVGIRYVNLEYHGDLPLLVNHAYMMMFKAYF